MLQPLNRFFAGNKTVEESVINEKEIVQLSVDVVIPNEYQPRTEFDDDKIKELAQTLQTHGILQPIVVRKKDVDTFELIAGERRLRAAKYLGWETISAIVREMDDMETASLALIENIQREQLSVMEEAKAYEQLLKMHSITQEALAQRLGKSQSTVANRIRLLSLPMEVQVSLANRKLTERHARALIKLKEEKVQLHFLNVILNEGLNVRETDELIKEFLSTDVEEIEEEATKLRPKRKIISKDIRIATNTIKQSLKMISDAGINVESEEEELEDCYKITLTIKK